MIVYKLTNLRIKSWKKKKKHQQNAKPFFHFTETTGDLGEASAVRPRCCSSAQTLTEESTWGQSRRAPLVAANKGQLNVTDFPARDVTTSVSGRHRNHCQESWAEDVPFSFFFCCHQSWHTCRLYYQQSPGLQETHGNWLSGLAPSLHLANACRPRPPDVTFPDDGKRKKIGLSISRLVFSHTFCPTCEVSFKMFSSCWQQFPPFSFFF